MKERFIEVLEELAAEINTDYHLYDSKGDKLMAEYVECANKATELLIDYVNVMSENVWEG